MLKSLENLQDNVGLSFIEAKELSINGSAKNTIKFLILPNYNVTATILPTRR